MSFRLWEAIKSPDNRAVVSWLGGGAVVGAGGISTVLTFVVEHKDASGKEGGTNITVQQGFGSVGEINALVTFGRAKSKSSRFKSSWLSSWRRKMRRSPP